MSEEKSKGRCPDPELKWSAMTLHAVYLRVCRSPSLSVDIWISRLVACSIRPSLERLVSPRRWPVNASDNRDQKSMRRSLYTSLSISSALTRIRGMKT